MEKVDEAAGCDQAELLAERMKLRPYKYEEAYNSIEKQYGRCNMNRLFIGQKETAELLGEEPDKEIVFPILEPKQKSVKNKDGFER